MAKLRLAVNFRWKHFDHRWNRLNEIRVDLLLDLFPCLHHIRLSVFFFVPGQVFHHFPDHLKTSQEKITCSTKQHRLCSFRQSYNTTGVAFFYPFQYSSFDLIAQLSLFRDMEELGNYVGERWNVGKFGKLKIKKFENWKVWRNGKSRMIKWLED